MNLQEIKTLHAFNAWASHRIFEATAALTPDQFTKDMKSSHGSIHGTLVHMVSAEKVWLGRWQGRAEPFLKTTDVPTHGALVELWEKTGFEIAKFLGTLTDKKLQDTFIMKTMKGETFEHVLWHAMQHVVDHSTYHRGQVITMLRQLGITPPSTGLIVFYREAVRR